ncbi:UNVERIFIED_CONTAM: Preprotein translocase subunit SCY2, chloroplastic [Sesamum indicum]
MIRPHGQNPKPETLRNMVLNYVLLGDFHYSGILLFMTVTLIVVSRIGYFIPLPRSGRRLKLYVIRLGISSQVATSILMLTLDQRIAFRSVAKGDFDRRAMEAAY